MEPALRRQMQFDKRAVTTHQQFFRRVKKSCAAPIVADPEFSERFSLHPFFPLDRVMLHHAVAQRPDLDVTGQPENSLGPARTVEPNIANGASDCVAVLE